MTTKDEIEQKETFNSQVGKGLGCLFLAIALGVLFSFDKILNIIQSLIICK